MDKIDYLELVQLFFRPAKPQEWRKDYPDWIITSFRTTRSTPVPQRSGLLIHVNTLHVSGKIYLIKVPTQDNLFDIHFIPTAGRFEEYAIIERFVKPEDILQTIANLLYIRIE